MKLQVFLASCAFLSILKPAQQVTFIPPAAKESYGDALEAIFGMGIRLQVLLQDPTVNSKENFIISPVSAAQVIGQLMLGAEGEFQDQLYDLLSLPRQVSDKNYILKTHTKNGQNITHKLPYSTLHLQLASLMRELRYDQASKPLFTLQSTNAVFVNHRIPLNPEFIHEAKLLYDSDIIPINFKRSAEAMMTINGWGSNHTNGLIKTMLQAPPGPKTSSIFANAIYFLGEWEQPFSSEINTEGPFHLSKNKSVHTTFMSGFLEQVPYAEHKELNCKMVVLPYKNRDLGMYIILPNKGHEHEHDIKAFASKARTADFLQMLDNLKDKDVNVKIPKLTLSTSINILEPLQRYASYKNAMKGHILNVSNPLNELDDKIKAFKEYKGTDYSDLILSAGAPNQMLRISNIYQQMTFAINEKGTEAAAITAGIMDYNGGSKTFLANKAFMFFIRHEATGATLFWGTISNPNA